MMKIFAGLTAVTVCCEMAPADLIVPISAVRTASAEAAVLQDSEPFIVDSAFDTADEWDDFDLSAFAHATQGVQAHVLGSTQFDGAAFLVSFTATSAAQMLQPPYSSLATASAVWDVWFAVTQDSSFQLTGLVGSLGAPDLASQTSFRLISQGNEANPIIFASPSNASIVPLEANGVLTAGIYRITANILTSSANGSTHSAAVDFNLFLSPVPSAPTFVVLAAVVFVKQRRRHS